MATIRAAEINLSHDRLNLHVAQIQEWGKVTLIISVMQTLVAFNEVEVGQDQPNMLSQKL